MLKRKTIENIVNIIEEEKPKVEKTLSEYYKGYLEGTLTAYKHVLGDYRK